MAVELAELRHPSWYAAAGTVAGYLLILALLAALLFVVPWLIFVLL